jgi:hypothetical protein
MEAATATASLPDAAANSTAETYVTAEDSRPVTVTVSETAASKTAPPEAEKGAVENALPANTGSAC